MLPEYACDLDGGARLSLFHHTSAVLADNPLGDACARAHPLLVPEGGGAGLPLVAVLVGFTGFGHKVLNRSSLWGENLPQRFARLQAAGSVPPAVYVWPSCETRLGGSQYLDSPATGRYETFLLQELLPAVEHAHGCGGAGRRVVVGKSSGGYGALTLSMRNAGYFAAAGSHAGDMGFEFGYRREFPDALNAWRKHGGAAEFLTALASGTLALGGPEHAALDTLAMASCYSPSASEALGYELPVDPDTGEPREDVFARWLEHDPLRMIEQPEHAAALRALALLYLDAGERDEFALQWGLRRFLPRLEAHDVPYEVEFFEGGHFDMDARYEVSLPRLLAAVTGS